MRRLVPSATLAAGLAAVLLTGCGESQSPGRAADTEAAGPRASPSSPAGSGAADPDGPAGVVETVAIVTETAVGGSVSTTATPLPDQVAVDRFAEQFTGDRMAGQLSEVVAGADVPGGSALWGAVVAIGCDTPDEVEVTTAAGDVRVAPVADGGRAVQCLAPMTSVALVLVPDAG